MLNQATASATPSSNPIKNTEKPMNCKYSGITGYSILLATSVNRLTNDSSQTARVR